MRRIFLIEQVAYLMTEIPSNLGVVLRISRVICGEPGALIGSKAKG